MLQIPFGQNKRSKKCPQNDSLTLKHHNSFQNLNNRKAIHRFAPRPLIAIRSFKIQ